MPDDFQIGSWLVEPSLNSVTCDGKVHRLEPKMMEVLVYLAQNQRAMVSKEQLMRVVWPDTFVTDRSKSVPCLLAETVHVSSSLARQTKVPWSLMTPRRS